MASQLQTMNTFSTFSQTLMHFLRPADMLEDILSQGKKALETVALYTNGLLEVSQSIFENEN